MKVIDLLNKKANGEEIPKKIIVKNRGIVIENIDEYVLYNKLYEEDIYINDEVEILEEEKEIPEKLDTLTYTNRNTISIWNEHRDKINEIIDCLDYLKSKGE